MHKVYVYVDSADTAKHAQVVAAVTDVIAEYGVRLLVHATDEQLQALQDAGLFAEQVDDLDVISLPSVVIDTRAGDPPAPPAEWAPAASAASKQFWLVLFPGPPLPEWADAVTAAGAEITGPMTESAVLARMTTAQANAVRALPHVQWVGLHQPLYTIEPALAGEPGPVPVTEQDRLAKAAGGNGFSAAERIELFVSLFEPPKLGDVQTAIESAGGTVQSAGGDTIICDLERSAIPGIADLAAVGHITQYVPPVTSLQFARPITQVQDVVDRHGLDGDGEVVGVADTGLDIGADAAGLHLDFKTVAGQNGRVTGYGLTGALPAPFARVVAGVPIWTDTDGHGTHVCGIVTGTGVAGGVPARVNRGVAPGAHLVIQSVLDGGNPAAVPNPIAPGLRGIPANVNTLFQPVYDTDGVRVHNNSWGMPAQFGIYTATGVPRQVDEFVWRNPDMVVVFASGNAGTDGPLNAAGPLAIQDGISDLTTMNPDGTFRNGIAVGGTENNRPAIPLAWNVNWATGSRFLQPPLAADTVASNPAQIMAFSGRGPTTAASGRRLKPDILAPGSSIFAPLSSLAPITAATNFWGARPAGSPYLFEGGTSMAAPHITGMAVLVREYLRRIHHFSDPENAVRRRRRPSAALVKAMLCHGAQFVNGMYGAAPQDNHGPLPSNHQGFGRADLRRTLFSNPITAHAALDAGHLPRRTIFVDDPDRTLNGLPAANPISRRVQEVQVRVADNTVPLRATLVWTDFPGPVGHAGKLVNRLELSIRRYNADATTTDFPLANPPGILPATMDPRTNNVQQIDLSGANLVAAPGVRYGIRVTAVRINSMGLGHNEEQDFALVVSGSLSHSDHKAPGTLAALPDLAFVDLEDTGGVRNHDGLSPSPPRPAANPGSPDIWVSREQNPDPARKVDQVEVGQPHYVYVRVRNLGFAPAAGAQVNVYWADRTQPAVFPGDWKTTGFKVDGATGNQRQVDVPARGEFVAGPFEWDPPRGFEQLQLFVRATHVDDPIVNDGDVRWDNNITSRDVTLADNSTHVGGDPSSFDRFVFWLISGFSSPRDIEANAFLSYQDIRDGKVKPLPGGLDLEVFDYDPVTGDDKMGQTRMLRTTLPDGKPATHAHLTFSTIESGEGSPDIYFRIPKPTGPEFADFIAGSFFSSGADAWSSKSQPDLAGGFYAENFTGDKIGFPTALELVVRPVGTLVRAAFEFFSGSEYRPLPANVPVRIVDAGDPSHVFVTSRTDAHGEINTVVARGDSTPDLAFRIVKNAETSAALAGVDFFTTHDTFDSATGQVEVLAADGSVASTVPGRFDHVDRDELVPAGQKLRFRLESPGIHVNVRFEYFDREAGTHQPLPAGTEVEVWEDAAAATQPLVRGVIGPNGRAELAVPRGSRTSFDLFVRVVMRRRLGPDPHAANAPAVTVTKAGAPVRFDTKGQTATDGTTAGRFANVSAQVPAAGAPPTFRIGVAADPNDEHAAPYVLRVIGEVDDWLRARSGGDWTGIPAVAVDLFSSAAEGSRPDLAAATIHLNSGHTATGAPQPDDWSRPAIAHQYAHLVIDKLFAALAHAGAVVGNHRLLDARTQQATRIALTEGFADYVAGRHLTVPVRPDSSANQTGWRGADNDGTKRSGETVPLAIANALWRLDDEIVGAGHTAITDAVNRRRFLALIWNPLKSLADADVNQVAYKLYRAIQTANVGTDDLLAGHDIAFLRQRVRAIFEANGLVFTRGRITSVTRQVLPPPGVWRLQLEPADPAKLHVGEMGRITAYRVQLRRLGTTAFVDLEQTVQVTHANQHEQLDAETGEALETGAVPTAGRYAWRVRAQDEFGTWDTFADDFTGNAAPTNTNDLWQQNILHSGVPTPAANNVP